MAKKKTFENIISNLLGEPVSNLCHAFYDQYVEANVKFRSRAGMKEVIIRRQLGKCCKWCADLAGIYEYGDHPDDIFRRHDNCKCMVTYKDEDGYTDVWSKKEFETNREARRVREIELSTNVEEERLRRIHFGDVKDLSTDSGTIKAIEITNAGNKLYMEKGIKLTRKEARKADKLISNAKSIHGIAEECNIPFVIIESKEKVASYNPCTDIVLISKTALNAKSIRKLKIGYACNDNINSTLVHELFHWKDAEDYRKQFGIIKESSKGSHYSLFQLLRAEEQLEKAGVDLMNGASIMQISEYAYKNLLANNLEEVYTEYRTTVLLGE